jgi:DNA (cytosine-5)-methyltransferase 1
MRYLSVCSGVGTDHIAWEGLGWECVGFAEIEPFASAVLAHHYPGVPNYGDFTTIPADVGPIDLLVGGTPCQSFSVAGQRLGLDDPRGNLTLEFARLARRLRARWIVWENVPGVLSSDGGRDFAAILTAFRECGYSVCYRVLDAQHYGVPQRRRRVFLVGHLGDDWRPSAEVLLEQAGVPGNTPAGRTPGEEVAGTLGGGSGSRDWNSDLDRTTFIPVEVDAGRVNGCLTTTYGSKNYSNHEEVMSGSLVSGTWVGDSVPEVAPALLQDCGTKYRSDQMVLLGGDWWDGSETATTVDSTSNDHRMPDKGRLSAVIQTASLPMPFDLAQITSKLNYSQARPGDMVPPLNTVAQMHVALAVKTAQTSSNGIGVAENVAYTLDGAQGQAIAFDAYDSENSKPGTIANPLRVGGAEAVAFTASEQSNSFAWERPHYPTFTAGAPTDSSNIQHGVRIGTVVRRLTPRECERLQGLPDDWTLVPYRGKPAADAPRYKAIGNGMAMPVLRWIGRRIAMVEGGKAR